MQHRIERQFYTFGIPNFLEFMCSNFDTVERNQMFVVNWIVGVGLELVVDFDYEFVASLNSYFVSSLDQRFDDYLPPKVGLQEQNHSIVDQLGLLVVDQLGY